jgi:hypothetical protein
MRSPDTIHKQYYCYKTLYLIVLFVITWLSLFRNIILDCYQCSGMLYLIVLCVIYHMVWSHSHEQVLPYQFLEKKKKPRGLQVNFICKSQLLKNHKPGNNLWYYGYIQTILVIGTIENFGQTRYCRI